MVLDAEKHPSAGVLWSPSCLQFDLLEEAITTKKDVMVQMLQTVLGLLQQPQIVKCKACYSTQFSLLGL